MSELRKPCFVFLLKNTGKKTKKIELFDAQLWSETNQIKRDTYRIRVTGKWFPKKEIRFFTKWEIRDLIWRSIDFKESK